VASSWASKPSTRPGQTWATKAQSTVHATSSTPVGPSAAAKASLKERKRSGHTSSNPSGTRWTRPPQALTSIDRLANPLAEPCDELRRSGARSRRLLDGYVAGGCCSRLGGGHDGHGRGLRPRGAWINGALLRTAGIEPTRRKARCRNPQDRLDRIADKRAPRQHVHERRIHGRILNQPSTAQFGNDEAETSGGEIGATPMFMTQDPRYENGMGPPVREITDRLGRCIRREDAPAPNGQRTESEQQERSQQIVGPALSRHQATRRARLVFSKASDQGLDKGSEDLRRESVERSQARQTVGDGRCIREPRGNCCTRSG